MAYILDSRYLNGDQKQSLLHYEFDYKKAQNYYDESKEYLSEQSKTNVEKSWNSLENKAIKIYPEVFGDTDHVFVFYGLEIPETVTNDHAIDICEELGLFPVLTNKNHRYIGTLIRKGKVQFGYDWDGIYEFSKLYNQGCWNEDVRSRIEKHSLEPSKARHYIVFK